MFPPHKGCEKRNIEYINSYSNDFYKGHRNTSNNILINSIDKNYKLTNDRLM